MSQTPTTARLAGDEGDYAAAWRQVNDLLRRGRAFSGHERNCCFLNVSGQPFANISAVSGFDFHDDGRGMAVSDWDEDGDLDVWTTNRTAPRIRFLKNDLASTNHFVQFRLQGTGANRDAIGARVELLVSGDPPTKLLRSLRAGEGYLSQSSKWVHFGLGEAVRIDGLSVRWPNGDVESFEPPQVDGRFRLIQGTGRTELAGTGRNLVKLQPTSPAPVRHSRVTQNLLTARVPLPPLGYRPFDGTESDLSTFHGAPILVNLWATWCPPCMVELADWTEHESELRGVGLEVIALSVDGLGDQVADQPDIPQVLKGMGFPFLAGVATAEFVDKLQMVHDVIYDHHASLPVPSSFLIDGNGDLAALYKGPVTVERLIEDVHSLKLTDDELLAAALPATGRWIANPGHHRVELIGQKLVAEGNIVDALAFAERLDGNDVRRRQQAAVRMAVADHFKDNEELSEASEQYREVIRLNPESVLAHMNQGICLSRQADLVGAAKHLAEASRLDAGRLPEVPFNYGIILRRLGKQDAAAEKFEQALQLDPSMAQAYAKLGLIRAGQGRYDEAVRRLREAVKLDGADAKTRVNLALSLEQAGNTDAAIQQLHEVMRLEPDSVLALVYAGEFLANKSGRAAEAIRYIQQAVKKQPQAAKLRFRLAGLLETNGDPAAALKEYREAERLVRGDPVVQSRIAWILATCPDDTIRRGAEAVRLAERAARKSQNRDAAILDVLAAAYAEVGRLDEASATAGLALQLARTTKQVELAAQIQQRLDEYNRGEAHRVGERGP